MVVHYDELHQQQQQEPLKVTPTSIKATDQSKCTSTSTPLPPTSASKDQTCPLPLPSSRSLASQFIDPSMVEQSESKCTSTPPSSPTTTTTEVGVHLYKSIKQRGFTSLHLESALDTDLIELATHVTLNGIESIRTLRIGHSPISDKGIEVLLASLAKGLESIELIGCNELSDSLLWTGITPTLRSLTVQDCINISDESIAAVCQLLPSLRHLHIQAYHVTDASMAYFTTSALRDSLRTLILQHCWEITNQGVANLAHSLPNLSHLSLSGCSKVSGRVERKRN